MAFATWARTQEPWLEARPLELGGIGWTARSDKRLQDWVQVGAKTLADAMPDLQFWRRRRRVFMCVVTVAVVVVVVMVVVVERNMYVCCQCAIQVGQS